mgnify:CR=1 FL=1
MDDARCGQVCSVCLTRDPRGHPGEPTLYSSFNARALGLDLAVEETIDLASAVGFDGVDLMVRDIVGSGRDPRALRRRLDDAGLRSGAFPLPIDWRQVPEPLFRRALGDLPRFAETAAIMGLTRTGTWVEPEAPALPGLDDEISLAVTFDQHLQRLGQMATVLDRWGVRLGLEVIGVANSRPGRGPAFITGLGSPRLKDLLTRLRERCPLVGILVDAWHLYAAGETIDTALGWGTDAVVWVHVADLPAGSRPDRSAMIDNQRGWPGDHGAIDGRTLLRRLAESGYDGPVTVEPMGQGQALGPTGAATKALESLRLIWPIERLSGQ